MRKYGYFGEPLKQKSLLSCDLQAFVSFDVKFCGPDGSANITYNYLHINNLHKQNSMTLRITHCNFIQNAAKAMSIKSNKTLQ